MQSLRNSMPVERVLIDSVKEYPNNPRVHSRKQRRKINSFIRRFGQVAPILVAPDLTIIDGHAFWFGLKEAGFTEIDVLRTSHPKKLKPSALQLIVCHKTPFGITLAFERNSPSFSNSTSILI